MPLSRLTIVNRFFIAVAALAVLFLFHSAVPEASAFEEMILPQAVDTTSWEIYENDFYKFKIKYPAHWADPWTKDMHEPGLEGVFQVSFSSEKLISDEVTGGFSIYIFKSDACTLGNGSAQGANCPSVELRKLKEAQSNYLYETSGGFYTYTFLPSIPADGFSLVSRENIISQFKGAVETFDFDPNARPAVAKGAVPKTGKVNSNRVSGFVGQPSEILAKTRTVSGRKVCAKAEDNPKPSKNNPKWQVDGECCLDPYEIPNSRCYYPPEKYGNLIQKYLAGQNK